MDNATKQSYSAYRYKGGSERGVVVDTSDNKQDVFNTAQMDAKAIVEAINDKQSEGRRTSEDSCRIIEDDKTGTIEIRQKSDGYLMYYYDILEVPEDDLE